MTGEPPDARHAPTAGANADGAAVRRPYNKPQLRRLGSVRELTLGKTGPFPDAAGMRKMGMGMGMM